MDTKKYTFLSPLFLRAPEEARRSVIESISAKLSYSPVAVEKDWWVTTALKAIYSLPYGKEIQFKGGTSLSKMLENH